MDDPQTPKFADSEELDKAIRLDDLLTLNARSFLEWGEKFRIEEEKADESPASLAALVDTLTGSRKPQEPQVTPSSPLDMKHEDLMKTYVKHLLRKNDNIKKKAVEQAGIHYNTFLRWANKYKNT